jgi:ligand-binding sensor domain-containing protein/signal transduction histidine kinase
MRCFSTFLLVFLSLVATLKAQNSVWQFKHLTSENGLESPDIQSVLQDKRGFLWVGTLAGLHRFDGTNCKVFKHEVSNPHSISSNLIYSLCEARDSTIWVGTRHGLNKFNPKTEKFIVYNTYNKQKILENKSIRHIYEDKRGFLWICVSSLGLLRFDPQKQKFDKWYNVENTDNLQFQYPKFIFEDSKNNIWIGSDDGIGIFIPKINKLINLPLDKLPSKYVKCILQDAAQNIWIGTDEGLAKLAGNKLLRYTTENLDKIEFEFIQSQEGKPNSLINHYVKSLTIDKDKNLWVGTDEGISILSEEKIAKQDYNFINLSYDEDNPHSLSNNYCKALFTDTRGIVWVGTGSGVSFYAKNIFPFQTFSHEKHNLQSLNDNYVKAICYQQSTDSTEQKIWLGTNSGLACYDRLKRQYTFYKTQNSNLTHNYIKALAQDKQNNLWIGTDKGLTKMNFKTLVMQTYFANDKDETAIPDNTINSLYADKNGEIWVGTWKGLAKYQPKTDNFKLIHPYFKDRIQTVLKDEEGEIWIGMREGLIRLANENSVNGIVYTHIPNEKNSLTSSYINCLYQINKGEIVIGTSNGGLNIFDKKTGNFRAITTKNGLISDNITFITATEKEKNILWLGTEKGLSKVSLDSLTVRNYTTEDGLLSNAFNHLVISANLQGEIFAGSVGGFIAFYPQKMSEENFTPPLYLSDFKLFQESVKLDKQSVLQEHISYQPKITLKHTDKMLTFEFVAIDYLNPHQLRYMYKLEGFDEEWIIMNNGDRQATYTNLPAGNYTFMVKLAGENAKKKQNITKIDLVILPPIWKTWWFIALIITSLILALYLFVRWRAGQLKKIQNQLKQQVAERTSELTAQKKVLENANTEIAINLEEIAAQRDEIEAQRDSITQINTSLEKLVAQRTEKLLEANKELDSFMYRAAHDLKGPLARIKGLIYLGKLETTNGVAIDYFDKLDSITGEMLQILNRIRYIHDIKNKVLEKEIIDFEVISNNILAIFIDQLDMDSLIIHTEIAPQLDFYSDKELIGVVLYNLLDNALKYRNYTTDNQIIITVKPSYSIAKNHTIEISVADNGIGIDDREKHRVFEMFFVGTPASNGMGLGLYEIKIIAEKLEGEVGFECKEGWTKFWVKL